MVLDDFLYYSQLAQGARYLAERSGDAAERAMHLAMAARYGRLSRGDDISSSPPAPAFA